MTVRYLALFLSATALLLAVQANAQTPPSRAAVLDQLARGTTAFRAGDMAGAAERWSQAIDDARRIGAVDLEAQALVRRGEANRVAGYLNNAASDLRAAVAKAEASGDQALIAASSGALGSFELSSQQKEAAEPLLTRSRDLARSVNDRRTLGSTDNDLGNLYAETSRPEAAARAYDEAVANADAVGDEVLAASADVNAARLALQRNDLSAALARLTRAVDRLERAPPSYNGGLALVSAGSLVLDHPGQLPASFRQTAERAFRAASAVADGLHNAALSSLASGGLGRLNERAGQIGAASALTDRALFAAQNANAPELSFRWDWQQARLAQQQGRYDEALTSYRRAVGELESIRQDIPVLYRDGRSSYRTTFGPLYSEYSDLLLRRARLESTRADALRTEARNTIEQLKESELQDYFRDSCISDFKARRQSVENIAPGSAILYPIAFADRLELLVNFGHELQQVTIPISEATLRQEATQFRELLEKRTTNEYLVPARELYDQIIRPIEPALAAHRIDTLVIVPDPILRIVPFGALHDGRHFLIERYATAIAPSMQLVDPEPLGASDRVALVLGVSQGVQGFVSLPDVPKEVAAVHSIEGGETLLDASFSKERFASELKRQPYNVVHIASHGQFGTEPKQTFILAYNGEVTMDELESDIKLSEHHDNALELLVLSACETASGDDRAALGLAGVALKAGARSAVASLWYVSDDASEKLVTDFYQELQSGRMSKAQALQAAQKQLLSSQRFGHPAYWAPYLLIGNWL